jgi:hypothetical protein
MPTPSGERSCATKNRMRELRSCGTVRDEGSNALVYSEASRENRQAMHPKSLNIEGKWAAERLG